MAEAHLGSQMPGLHTRCAIAAYESLPMHCGVYQVYDCLMSRSLRHSISLAVMRGLLPFD